MKRTPLKRKTPLRAKTGFKRTKAPLRSKKLSTRRIRASRGRSELKKAKETLWQLCRAITKKLYPHNCYTCGKFLTDGTADFHTGHFIPSSICSTELRYSLDNLRPQCSGCNVWKSGNWVAYEKHLIADKGEGYVRELKKRNEETKGKKYDIFWYQDMIHKYELFLKELS